MPDLSPVRVTIGETAGSYPANVVPPTGLPANTPNRFNARVVATGNISLSGTPVIDGYQTVVGDRVLAIGQTTASANGVYVVAATGSWQRAIDLSLASQFAGPVRVSVEVGTVGRSKTYQFLPTSTVVIGTTALVFTDADTWTKAAINAVIGISDPAIADGKGTFWDSVASEFQPLWAHPNSGEIDIRDMMDRVHGVGAWTLRSATGNGTNVTPALVEAATISRADTSYKTLVVPPVGYFAMKTAISDSAVPDALCGMNIVGLSGHEAGAGFCVQLPSGKIAFNYPASIYTGGGLQNLTIGIEAGSGNSGVGMISMAGNSSLQPDNMQFKNVRGIGFDALAGWVYHVSMIGTARTSPQGIRQTTFEKCTFFNGYDAYSFLAWNAVNLRVTDMSINTSLSATGADFYIGGGGAANTNTTQFDVRMLITGGQINLSNCTDGVFEGLNKAGSLNRATSATHIQGRIRTPSHIGTSGTGYAVTVW